MADAIFCKRKRNWSIGQSAGKEVSETVQASGRKHGGITWKKFWKFRNKGSMGEKWVRPDPWGDEGGVIEEQYEEDAAKPVAPG